MGACPATLVQPRPYSSPGVPALLPARRASPSGGREVRDKGVTYYSVDLGRVQRGGRDNDADRDVTVIPVIPGRRSHQGRCRGAGHHRAGRRRRRVPARGRRRPRVPARSVTSSSCAWRAPSPCRVVVVEPGHQFQLRTAVPLGRRGFSRCPSSPVPVAHCRSFLVAGAFRTWPQSRVPAVLPFAFARGFARRSPGPVAHRVPPLGTAGRWAGSATRLSAVAGSTVITPGTGAAHRLSRLLPAPPTSGDTSVVTRLRSADSETSRG